jgi:predicted DNA-binding transcriptional regulator YafY
VFSDRRLRLRYRRGEEEVVVREVDPYGLVLKAGTWYLLAGGAGGLRTYRISRVEDAEILDQTFGRPAGWDLEAAWSGTVRAFRDRGAAVRVSVRLRPGASGLFLRMAAEHLAGPVADRVPTLVFPAIGAAAAFLAGYVSEVEVLAPEELRARIAGIGEGLVRAYSTGAASSEQEGGEVVCEDGR